MQSKNENKLRVSSRTALQSISNNRPFFFSYLIIASKFSIFLLICRYTLGFNFSLWFLCSLRKPWCLDQLTCTSITSPGTFYLPHQHKCRVTLFTKAWTFFFDDLFYDQSWKTKDQLARIYQDIVTNLMFLVCGRFHIAITTGLL